MSENDQLRAIANEYMTSGQAWPATVRQIAAWAIEKGLWQPQLSDPVGQCADLLAKAMCGDCITDPQGRTLRAKHAARFEQQGKRISLWADIRTASRQHLEAALRQRRQQIVSDCQQLKADVDSFNETRSAENPIEMDFDFTHDLEGSSV